MITKTLAHVDCERVAGLVAAELPDHATHAALLRQDDTLDLAMELLRARPADDSERAQGIREGLEIAIRVAFIRAGLPVVGLGPLPERNGTETNA